MLRNVSTALTASLLLGLAPFVPEPHIVGKLRWLAGGANGMGAQDWFDLVMHGAPWVWLAIALILRLPFFNQKWVQAVRDALARQAVVLDVRSVGEFNAGSAPGASSVPLDTLPKGAEKLTKGVKNRPIIVFCRSGARASRAASILKSQGYTAVLNLGGLGNAKFLLKKASL